MFQTSRKVSIVTILALLIFVSNEFVIVHAIYIPGIQRPITYKHGQLVPLKVNSLTSTQTQMTRDYYHLPFCLPEVGPKMVSESLGELLTGNKIQNSPYSIKMLQELYCEKLCQVTLNDPNDVKDLRYHITTSYHHNWIIDNLPSAALGVDVHGNALIRYAGGFPIGYMDTNKINAYIYNHVNIHIDYHETEEGYRVVAFAIESFSVKHKFEGNYDWDETGKEGMNKKLRTCPNYNVHLTWKDIQKPQIVKLGEKILFTYDVTWKASDVEWTSRWDIYLSEGNLVPPQDHWYSIANSMVIAVFLSLAFISVFICTLRCDICSHNTSATLNDEEINEGIDERGWRAIHADVFRPPQSHPMLYCVFLGSGTQLSITALFVIILSVIGFISPAKRGSQINAILVIYSLSGVVAGYTSSRIYKAFRGRQWKLCAIITSLFFPGISFGTFLCFNIIIWMYHSSASVPLFVIFMVGVLWCCVSIPLVFLGAYFGNNTKSIEFPTETSTIARAIPKSSLLLNPIIVMILTGLLSFAAAIVELHSIMLSLWMNQFYTVFDFTLIAYIIIIVTCVEATIVLVFIQFYFENHRWWWIAFFNSGNTAFYIFIYSFFWFRTLKASILSITTILYFGYMLVICLAILLLLGTIGSLTSLWFACHIFSNVKND